MNKNRMTAQKINRLLSLANLLKGISQEGRKLNRVSISFLCKKNKYLFIASGIARTYTV